MQEHSVRDGTCEALGGIRLLNLFRAERRVKLGAAIEGDLPPNESRDNSREHIAATAFCHACVARRVHPNLAAWPCSQAAVTLQHNNTLCCRCEPSCSLNPLRV